MSVTTETTSVDHDFYPAWIAENPALFAARVSEFIDAYPDDLWEKRVSKFAFILRFTATRRAATMEHIA